MQQEKSYSQKILYTARERPVHTLGSELRLYLLAGASLNSLTPRSLLGSHHIMGRGGVRVFFLLVKAMQRAPKRTKEFSE